VSNTRLGIFAVATTEGVSIYTPTSVSATERQIDPGTWGTEEGYLPAEKVISTHEVNMSASGETASKPGHAHTAWKLEGR
jgi:hypothetical protein